MAELIVDGTAQAVDLAPFDPGRMPRHDPTRLRIRSYAFSQTELRKSGPCGAV